MARPERWPIAEIFGPTIQGEGLLVGRPTFFVRFGGCDYACTWCDSAHAVLAESVRQLPKMDANGIRHALRKQGAAGRPGTWVTLSGGNPALHALSTLVRGLREDGFSIAVETQGTKWPGWLAAVNLLTISPKGPSSGNETPALEFIGALHAFMNGTNLPPGRVVLKVVIFTSEDYEYARALHQALPGIQFYLSVGTMMGGLRGDAFNGVVDDRDAILDRARGLAEKMAADPEFKDAAVLPQLHALLWPVLERGH